MERTEAKRDTMEKSEDEADLYVTDADLDREVESYMAKEVPGVLDGACLESSFAPTPAPETVTEGGRKSDGVMRERTSLATIPEETEEERRAEKVPLPKVVEGQDKAVTPVPRTCDDGILEPAPFDDGQVDLQPNCLYDAVLFLETTPDGARGWLTVSQVGTGVPYIREEINSSAGIQSLITRLDLMVVPEEWREFLYNEIMAMADGDFYERPMPRQPPNTPEPPEESAPCPGPPEQAQVADASPISRVNATD